MGDMADLDRDRFLDLLADGAFDGSEGFEEEDAHLMQQIRREVRDMNLARERTFGDELMRFLEKRKDMSRARKFFDRWRNN